MLLICAFQPKNRQIYWHRHFSSPTTHHRSPPFFSPLFLKNPPLDSLLHFAPPHSFSIVFPPLSTTASSIIPHFPAKKAAVHRGSPPLDLNGISVVPVLADTEKQGFESFRIKGYQRVQVMSHPRNRNVGQKQRSDQNNSRAISPYTS